MKFQAAKDSGMPFRWENWPGWYRWHKDGYLEPVEKSLHRAVHAVPVHMIEGDKWEIDDRSQPITWYRAALLWHRKGKYYRQGLNYYPSKEQLTQEYEREYVIVQMVEMKMPKEWK